MLLPQFSHSHGQPVLWLQQQQHQQQHSRQYHKYRHKEQQLIKAIMGTTDWRQLLALLHEFKLKAAAASQKRQAAAAAGRSSGRLHIAAATSFRGSDGVTSVTTGVTSVTSRGTRAVLPAAALSALLLQLAKLSPEGAAAMAGERDELREFISEVGQ
jgi:hypothetical protein